MEQLVSHRQQLCIPVQFRADEIVSTSLRMLHGYWFLRKCSN
jgi:hypothetical protein